jgi:hypothetical protein
MDVLAVMFDAAVRAGTLPALPAGLKHRVSLYADDVPVFMSITAKAWPRPSAVTRRRWTPSPTTSSARFAISPAPTWGCLSLSEKPRKADLQLVLDKLSNNLAFWKACLLSMDGRVAYVQAVMTASVIYHLMALDVDPWFIQVVDRIRRGFLWAGKLGVRGGCCLVA